MSSKLALQTWKTGGNMQKWEYLTIYKNRVWENEAKNKALFRGATPWENSIVFQTSNHPKTEEFPLLLNNLGEQGWELIAVSPRSSFVGTSGYAAALAGFTDTEVWVFKRPKE
jgi:hypothetical protein